MQIRPAAPDDVPAVLPMVAKICALHEQWDPAKYNFLPNPAEMYRGWLRSRAKDPRSVFLVAEREASENEPARIAGFLVATVETEIPIYRLKEYGFIHDLWIEPEYRHEGLARQMTMLAIEKFRDIGVTQIRLDTAAANDPARALFASCGFRISTIEMLHEIEKPAASSQ
jgi:ribosomal protein S18 acetylase RimI-like enzyme